MTRDAPLGPDVGSTPRNVPPRALVLSLLALVAPLAATTLAPRWAETDGALLIWLPALLPPFLLAYYKGWQGASLALAGGMAALALSQVGALLLDLPAPRAGFLFAIVVLLVTVSVGAGLVAELLHRERDAAERAALTDALTGLPNRRHAEVFLDAAWGAALRGSPVALVLFDLDHFKQVNDRRGHAEGDRVLKELANILSRRTRRMDISARFGGEEFVSILRDCTSEQAVAFARSVIESVRTWDLGWGRVTLSAGVSMADPAMGSPDVLVAAADRALYRAKEQGRDRVVLTEAPDPGEPERKVPPPATDAPDHALKGCRVLLVDDDESSLLSTQRLLEQMGCVVYATGSSRDALSRLMEGTPADVLTTDIVMPDMSGFTLAELAGKARPGLPVLYVSGYPRDEAHWGGTPGSRSTFLGKPLESEEVRSALLGLLGT